MIMFIVRQIWIRIAGKLQNLNILKKGLKKISSLFSLQVCINCINIIKVILENKNLECYYRILLLIKNRSYVSFIDIWILYIVIVLFVRYQDLMIHLQNDLLNFRLYLLVHRIYQES